MAAGKHRPTQRGFTLTELLVVVGIIVLLVAVSVPAFLSSSRSGRLPKAVRQVQASLMGASNLAITHNSIYSVELGRIADVMQSGDMDLVALLDVDDTSGDGVIQNSEYAQTDLSDSDIFEAEREGCFLAIQAESVRYPWEDPGGKPDDYIVHTVAKLPSYVAFAYGSRPNASPNSPRWTAMPGWQGDTDEAQEYWNSPPGSWTTPSSGVPDVAFLPDGSCPDGEGETTIVLYDTSEVPDADGNVTVAVITVVKYTGEILIDTHKALLADVGQ